MASHLLTDHELGELQSQVAARSRRASTLNRRSSYRRSSRRSCSWWLRKGRTYFSRAVQVSTDLTGPAAPADFAGTGKSVLLRELIKNLRRKYATVPDAVAVTASTGIAACNIGGVTLNSFGGVGLGIEPADVLSKKIRQNKKASARWLRTKVLIIDESE